MSQKNEAFLKKLRETFKTEADEHLQAISTGLLALEKASTPDDQRNIVETVFRAAHSLKGAARAVDFSEVESLCQSLEDVFASLKQQASMPSANALDTLHQALDAIGSTLASTNGSPGANGSSDWTYLCESLQRLADSVPQSPEEPGKVKPKAPAPVEPAQSSWHTAENASSEETVRVAVAKLETQLLEAEEMLMAKFTASQRAADLRELAHLIDAWRSEWTTVELDLRGLRRGREHVAIHGERRSSHGLTRLLDFFDWSMDYFTSVENRTATLSRKVAQDGHVIGKLVDDLLEDSKQLLLLPFSTISASFPKLVRDLCRDQGKEADFTMIGEDAEIDKHILEEMKDPLVHLLRNSIGHGVEPSSERARLGKPARATITLTVLQVNDNKVQILVSDDGAGIDVGKVKTSAIKHGLISAEAASQLGEAEAQALIFHSAVSTSPIITQLSGRGLGLAIVRERAEKLDGTVSVESHAGLGTTFRIIIPATRATFRGILVDVAGRQLVVPTTQVHRVTRVKSEDIQTVEGRETITLDARTVALVQLSEVLELPSSESNNAQTAGTQVIVLGSGEQRIAFVVDAVLDELEVLVKTLPKPLSRVRNVAAATVLGSGQVVPILNVADLLKSARKVTGVTVRTAAAAAPKIATSQKILVVEDSITSRMLLKSILESAGYNVQIAVDGMDAFTRLRADRFDLVVSDVEMPRLNGLDLTARIRADKKMAELPVVLVTALEKREDRERGIDVGANAYLVKSNFDQSGLLEAVQRLI